MVDYKKVLLDGDIIAYRSSFAAQDGTALEACQKADILIEYIWEETLDFPFPTEDDYHIYLTGNTNFRNDIAKTAPYKGQRKQERPDHLNTVRKHLVDNYHTTVSEGEEADDLIAIEATRVGEGAIIASIDKDFLQVPCKHFNFTKGSWATVTEEGGLKFFYTQVLTGDTVDNIKGVPGIGPKKAEKILEWATTEQELYKACLDAYEGNVELLLENARLLWLRRYPGEMWNIPDET